VRKKTLISGDQARWERDDLKEKMPGFSKVQTCLSCLENKREELRI
jgi:hypothetical protein